MQPVAILAAGMVTSVGSDAPSSCAAMRCAIDNFSDTRFIDNHGEWIVGSQVQLEQPWRGSKRLVHMVVPAIRECLASVPNVKSETIPVLLCVAEKDRPGRVRDLDTQIFEELQSELGIRFHSGSSLVALGRIGGAIALDMARKMTQQKRLPLCLIAGVDSFLVGETLKAYEAKQRLLTSRNSNGFIPGEAGAAVLVGPPESAEDSILVCVGIGLGHEKATIDSEEPLRADGLAQAIRSAFVDSQARYEDVHYRLSSANGEQYWFKEAALALTRTMRVRKQQFHLWHVADCIGETGAAAVPCALGVALAATRKSYAPGPGVLCQFGNDGGERIAMVLKEH